MIKTSTPDIVFLDIQMDEMIGLELAAMINAPTRVVFCTGHPEFAATSYDLDASDYLLKPVTFNRFVKAIQKATTSQPSNACIFIKTGVKGQLQKIDFDEIDYIEAKSNYCIFHRGGKGTISYILLRELEQRLPASLFMRVHKSYIVAMRAVAGMELNEIGLKGTEIVIPVGGRYRGGVVEWMRGLGV
jgi:DNA-binding LytR/AlgR family response regulator